VQLSYWHMFRVLGGWDDSHPSDAQTVVSHLHLAIAIGRQRLS